MPLAEKHQGTPAQVAPRGSLWQEGMTEAQHVPCVGSWRGRWCVWGRARALVCPVHTSAVFNWSRVQLLQGGEQGGDGKNTKQTVRFGSQSRSLTQQDGPG